MLPVHSFNLKQLRIWWRVDSSEGASSMETLSLSFCRNMFNLKFLNIHISIGEHETSWQHNEAHTMSPTWWTVGHLGLKQVFFFFFWHLAFIGRGFYISKTIAQNSSIIARHHDIHTDQQSAQQKEGKWARSQPCTASLPQQIYYLSRLPASNLKIIFFNRFSAWLKVPNHYMNEKSARLRSCSQQ